MLTAGRRLRDAREAAGLSLDDISSQTKIARRHLEAIENDRFGSLASRTYAIGFARSYARALDLDETSIAECVRSQLASEDDLRPAPAEKFEPGDPARVPPSQLAWVAALGAVAVLVFLFVFWRSFLDPAGSLPDLVEDKPAASSAPAPKQPTAGPPAAAKPVGAVVLTAMAEPIWVKVSDARGNQIYQKEMSQGERFTIPADADGPVLSTARPDALQISVGGTVLPRIAATPMVVRDVPVTPAALGNRESWPEPQGAREPPPPASPAPPQRGSGETSTATE